MAFNKESCRGTKIDKEAYLKNKGTQCPSCKSKELECGSFDVDGGTAKQEVWCTDCGFEWDDIYTLTGIEA